MSESKPTSKTEKKSSKGSAVKRTRVARAKNLTSKLSEITELTTIPQRKAAVEKNLGESQPLSAFLNGVGWR